VVDAGRAQGLYAEVRKYWPSLQDRALAAGYAGIRPTGRRSRRPISWSRGRASMAWPAG